MKKKVTKNKLNILFYFLFNLFVLQEWIRYIGKAIVASRRGDAWQDDVDAYGNPREKKQQ